jgi:hypothetical protein
MSLVCVNRLMVVVNVFFAVAFVMRVKWVAWPFLLLTAQQVWSHGGDIVRGREEHPPVSDVQSLFALGGIALIWLLLWARRRAMVRSRLDGTWWRRVELVVTAALAGRARRVTPAPGRPRASARQLRDRELRVGRARVDRPGVRQQGARQAPLALRRRAPIRGSAAWAPSA